jgi:non-lysosomal glucosylceramidase
MGDSSSAFVLEVLELYRWANDTATVKLYWETVKKVVLWQLKSSAAYGVPSKLETSYDLLGFPAYEIAAYNSVFHIATLAAAAELADAMADGDFAETCRSEQAAAAAAFDTLQYNRSAQFYNAGSDGCTAKVGCKTGTGLFADTFYAQVLAYSSGLGTLVEQPGRLVSHLQAQLEQNCIHFAALGPGLFANASTPGCPNGMVIMTNRPAHSSDLQIWEMAPPNHATLGLHLGLPLGEMLRVFEGSATSYSRRINDQVRTIPSWPSSWANSNLF